MEQQLPPYALCLPRYAKMDGNYPNAPDRIEKGSYGYISTALSGPDGRFGNPPAITVTFDRLKTSNGVYLVFNRLSGDYASVFLDGSSGTKMEKWGPRAGIRTGWNGVTLSG